MEKIKELIIKKNEKVQSDFKKSIEKIRKIEEETKDSKDLLMKFANSISQKILFFVKMNEEYSPNWYKTKDLEELKKINNTIFQDVLPENYETSFANPEFCTNEISKEFGALLATFYIGFRSFVTFAKNNLKYKMCKWNNLFLEIYPILKNEKVDFKAFNKIFIDFKKDIEFETALIDNHFSLNPEMTKNVEDFILNVDTDDLRYLYQYNEFVSENEVKTAEFLKNYSEKNIDTLVNELVKAYIRGFEIDNKDISIKETVLMIYNIGEERIIKKLIPKLKENNLIPIFSRISSSDFNEQYQYDHKFNSALFLDEKFSEKSIMLSKQVSEATADIVKKFSGPLVISKFGKSPFNPKDKDSNLKFSDEQKQLTQKMMIAQQQERQKYMPRNETSFCMIAFPSPEIGKDFEKIYEETFEINMLDSEKYEAIQKNIIEELDKADYVHIKGKDDNITDLKVKIQKLKNPENETNFNNCGATVNIPVGEVFTSPQLEGTTGTLHVKDTYLAQLNYQDLKLDFEDGFVKEYSCNNFKDEKKNKEFIENNLLFPHKTLPMGEFAIGTNTHAYVMAQKYKIGKLLPVLIGEKMGPHFAIGDTCFSWSEDDKTYNPISKKEIKSKDNSKTLARKKGKMNEAYTNCHTDITIPYEELESIEVVTYDGTKIPIILDGKFVVKGTEELNEPLAELGI